MNPRPPTSRKLLPLAGALAAALCGCADLQRATSLPPVNPESPVAAEVRAGAPLSYVTPRLADVPPVPKNVPLAGEVKRGVIDLVRCRGGIARFALDHPPLSAAAAQFAAAARETAKVDPADVPPPESSARSEAAAADLRAYAAPPGAFALGPPPSPNEGKPADLQTPGPPPPPRRRAAAPGRPAPAAPLAPTARGLAAAAPSSAPAAVSSAPAAPSSAAADLAASGRGAAGVADAPSPMPAPPADPYYARCT